MQDPGEDTRFTELSKRSKWIILENLGAAPGSISNDNWYWNGSSSCPPVIWGLWRGSFCEAWEVWASSSVAILKDSENDILPAVHGSSMPLCLSITRMSFSFSTWRGYLLWETQLKIILSLPIWGTVSSRALSPNIVTPSCNGLFPHLLPPAGLRASHSSSYFPGASIFHMTGMLRKWMLNEMSR